MIILYYLIAVLAAFLLPCRAYSLVLKKKGIYTPIYSLLAGIFTIIPDFLIRKSWGIYFDLFGTDGEYVDFYVVLLVGILFVNIGLVSLLLWKFAPKVNNRRIRKVPANNNYTLWAFIGSPIIVLYSIYCDTELRSHICFEDIYIDWVVSFLFYFGLVICVLLFFINMRRLDKIKDEATRTLDSLKTHRAPIIFLRSFELDKDVLFGRTFDEYICNSFSMTSQPILSLADPDNYLPTGGSIKVQSYDDRWKPAIEKLLRNCRAVVLFEGKSEGLHWEISHLKEFIKPEQLFVVTPPERYRRNAWIANGKGYSYVSKKEKEYIYQYVWGNFSKYLNTVGFDIPTVNPGCDSVLRFGDNWKANEVVKLKGMQLFDYILEKSVMYENVSCDYQSLSRELQEYELSNQLSSAEKAKLKTTMIIVAFVEVVGPILSILLLGIFF